MLFMHKNTAPMKGFSFMSPSLNGRGHVALRNLKASLVSIFYSFHGFWAETVNAIAVGICLRHAPDHWELD